MKTPSDDPPEAPQAPQRVLTGDGSHTLRVPALDETYHAPAGALAEARHVYVGEGLAFYWRDTGKDPIRLLEVGFGTGLNALLSLHFARENRVNLHYLALEPHPLPADTCTALNYCALAGLEELAPYFDRMHRGPWDVPFSLDPFFTLEKRRQRLQDIDAEAPFDTVYFDAFAPEKQPELWQPAQLGHVADMMAPAAVLVSYCAQGHFKRTLRALGLAVKRRPGPAGGKFHMVRARKEMPPTQGAGLES